MNQTEIKEAIAQQEAYLKRREPCGGFSFTPHSWAQFAAAPGVYYRACTACRATETDADYQTKRGVQQ